ncbi:MAG: cytochrome b/b6 domain-containing protein [Proteobacteria bacterium]|nr:cytochrome b/b6 domain-containing protein [Pseudomonadota bacterium]
MDLVRVRDDVWGREVLAGVSWDLLWLVLTAAFAIIIAHLLLMAVLNRKARPSAAGKKLARHAGVDRAFHWITAIATIVLLVTGVFPIIGINFPWLTPHWIAGLVLTVAVGLHVVRSLFFQDPLAMWIAPSDLKELAGGDVKTAKYSLAQKGMHLGMAVVVLVVIVTGLVLFLAIDTPWWNRTNSIDEATLGWLFLLHGASTLGLVGLTALHIYFGLRPEKLFYTRSMIKGWISEHEHAAHHDAARWSPEETR